MLVWTLTMSTADGLVRARCSACDWNFQSTNWRVVAAQESQHMTTTHDQTVWPPDGPRTGPSPLTRQGKLPDAT